MNIRRIVPAHVAALLVMIAALFLGSATGQAQAIDCSRCDYITVRVHANLSCPVTICYTTGPVDVCRVVAPGESIRIPCSAVRAWVVTCSGSYVIIPSSSTAICSPDLKFAVGCCGRICNVPSLDPCPTLEIQPLPCNSLSCP